MPNSVNISLAWREMDFFLLDVVESPATLSASWLLGLMSSSLLRR